MQPIHIEPEELHLTSRVIWQQNLQMSEAASSLQIARAQLEMAWLGDSSEEVTNTLQNLIRQLQVRIEELERLGLTLSREAERWQESDQTWSRIFRDEIIRAGN